MAELANLTHMQARMAEEQRALILRAAEADMLPPFGAISHIASLEGALDAVDALLEQAEAAEPKRNGASERPSQASKAAAPVPPPAPAMTGTVKWFNATKGYGFITPDQPGPDVFVHISAVQSSGLPELREGQHVAYGLKPDARTGKQAADQLRALGERRSPA